MGMEELVKEVQGTVEAIKGSLLTLKHGNGKVADYLIGLAAGTLIRDKGIGVNDRVAIEFSTENGKQFVENIKTEEKEKPSMTAVNSAEGIGGEEPAGFSFGKETLADGSPTGGAVPGGIPNPGHPPFEEDLHDDPAPGLDEENDPGTEHADSAKQPVRHGIVAIGRSGDGYKLYLCDYRTLQLQDLEISEEAFRQLRAKGIRAGSVIDDLKIDDTDMPTHGAVRTYPPIDKVPFALSLLIEHDGKNFEASLFEAGDSPARKTLAIPPAIFPDDYSGSKKFIFNIRLKDETGEHVISTLELKLRQEDLARLSVAINSNGFLLLQVDDAVKAVLPLHDHIICPKEEKVREQSGTEETPRENGTEKTSSVTVDKSPASPVTAAMPSPSIASGEPGGQSPANIAPGSSSGKTQPPPGSQPVSGRSDIGGFRESPDAPPPGRSSERPDLPPASGVEGLASIINTAVGRLESSLAKIETALGKIVKEQRTGLRLESTSRIITHSQDLSAEIMRWRKANGEEVGADDFKDHMFGVLDKMAVVLYSSMSGKESVLKSEYMAKLFEHGSEEGDGTGKEAGRDGSRKSNAGAAPR